ncbi:MAG: hypothetical protein ABIT05_06720 [Chitinophagaceae bacterium]
MFDDQTILKCNTDDLPDNIIGAAVLVESGKVQHAGIFVRYNGESKLFHFTSKDVLLEDVNDKDIYFFKVFSFIKPALTPAFLAHCQIVLKEAQPKFGYFYVGAEYDADGKFRSLGDFPEYMTCVGFCLNFLKYFTNGVDLFEVDDWTTSDLKRSEEYLEKFLARVKEENPKLDMEAFRKGLRRIWPTEYFSGNYSPSLPVRKQFVDGILDQVTGSLLTKARA